MGSLVLDAGVLIAYERRERAVERWLRQVELDRGRVAIAAPTVAEVWRDGARQARLARLLGSCLIVDCDQATGRDAGRLLALVGSDDTLDALVVATAARLSAAVLTEDPADLLPLGEAAGVAVARLNPR